MFTNADKNVQMLEARIACNPTNAEFLEIIGTDRDTWRLTPKHNVYNELGMYWYCKTVNGRYFVIQETMYGNRYLYEVANKAQQIGAILLAKGDYDIER